MESKFHAHAHTHQYTLQLQSPAVAGKEFSRFVDEALEPHLQSWRELLALTHSMREADVLTVYSSSSSSSASSTTSSRSSGNGSALAKRFVNTNSIHPDNCVGRLTRTFRLLTGVAGAPSGVFSPGLLSSPRMAAAVGISVSVGIPQLPKQEDAGEFLTYVLDTLHEELRATGQAPLAVVVPTPTYTRGPFSVASGGPSDTYPHGDTSSDDEVWCDPLSGAPTPAPEAYKEARTGEVEGSGAAGGDDDGWVEIKAQSKPARVVVDRESRSAAEKAVASTVVGTLFHSVMRSEVHYHGQALISATFQKSHCLTLNVDAGSVPTRHPVTPSASPIFVVANARGNNNAYKKGNAGNNYPPTPPAAADGARTRSQDHAGAASRDTTQECTLNEVLASHFGEEIVSAGQSNRITKRVTLDRAPPVLVLQLNRLAYDFNKDAAVKVKYMRLINNYFVL